MPKSASASSRAVLVYKQQEAFEKCWAHSPLRVVLPCHSPGVATVARRLRIDVHNNDDNT